MLWCVVRLLQEAQQVTTACNSTSYTLESTYLSTYHGLPVSQSLLQCSPSHSLHAPVILLATGFCNFSGTIGLEVYSRIQVKGPFVD